jgi:hypothetical protein
VRLLALVQELLQDFDNLVTDLLGALVTSEILGPKVEASLGFRVQDLGDGAFDQGGLFGLAERVAEHHGGREDGSDGVGDRLTGNVGCGTVNAGGFEMQRSGVVRRSCTGDTDEIRSATHGS